MMRASSYVGSRSSVETGYGNMLTNVNVMLVSTIAQIARPMNPTLLKISHFFIKGGSKNKKINSAKSPIRTAPFTKMLYGPKPKMGLTLSMFMDGAKAIINNVKLITLMGTIID